MNNVEKDYNYSKFELANNLRMIALYNYLFKQESQTAIGSHIKINSNTDQPIVREGNDFGVFKLMIEVDQKPIFNFNFSNNIKRYNEIDRSDVITKITYLVSTTMACNENNLHQEIWRFHLYDKIPAWVKKRIRDEATHILYELKEMANQPDKSLIR